MGRQLRARRWGDVCPLDSTRQRFRKGENRALRHAKALVTLSAAALVIGSIATGLPASAASAGSAPFSDISGSSEASAITFLASINAVNGVGGGMFDPSGPITRAEMAKVVVNLIGKGNVAAALQNETPAFTDAASIPTWAWGYVNVAADMGIVNGFPDGSFQPNAPVTDVQVAAMLVRAIGDSNQVLGAWPGNYVEAAFSLGMNDGVDFVANLPATRGDVAQMAYNAAVYAPVYTATTVNGITSYVKGLPLYQSGAVNGNTVEVGTVTGVSNTGITLSETTSSGTTTVTRNWASTYQLAGVSSLASLIGETVTANVDSNGNVDFVTLAQNQSATTSSATLASKSTAVPSGFYDVNSNWPWLVTNSYTCGDGSGNVAESGLGATVNGVACGGTYYLLLGGTSPTTVQLATYDNVPTGTTYEINPASDGSDPGTVPDVTYLSANDAVTYTLNSSNMVASLVEKDANDSIGRVASTACASGCDNTIATGATPYVTVYVGGKSYNVNVQPYTQLTLNGASATLSKALDGAVAYVSAVGGYGTNTGAPNPGTGDGNAATIALYQNQVTGTVTAINTSSAAPNISSGNSGQVISFTLSLSNGSSQTYTADANFNSSHLIVGSQVTVALDSAGEARDVVSTTATSTPTVALVTGSGEVQTLGVAQAVYTIAVQDVNGAQSFDVPQPYTGQVYSSTYKDGGSNGNNGAILYLTNASGQAVSPSGANDPQPMTQATPAALFNLSGQAASNAANDMVGVVSTTSNSVVLGLFTCGSTCGTSAVSWSLDTADAPNPYISVVAGAAFAGSTGDNLAFTSLNADASGGDWVTVYSATQAGGQTYYALIAQTQ